MKLTTEQFTTAISLASKRGLMPSALSSAELQATLSAGERRRVLALARVTRARFLDEVKRSLAPFMTGGVDAGKGQLIAALQGVLQRLGYDPATGFPGDDKLGIPPAEPGSLTDLSSWKRLELIMETERAIANGVAQKLNGSGEVAVKLFPAWQLVRIETRDQPRGSIDSGSPGWGERWVKFGGPPLVDDGGRLLMIAGKGDPIWQRLGDQSQLEAHGISDLALGVDSPPFCINSGYGWMAVSAATVRRLGITLRGTPPTAEEAATLPPVKTEAKSLTPATRDALQAKLKLIEQYQLDRASGAL